MIPDGWKEGCVSEVVASLEAGASVNGEDRPKANGEIGVLKVSAVSYSRFDPTAYKTVVNSYEVGRLTVNPKQGAVIVSRANTSALVGASVYIEKDYPDLFLPDKLWRITTTQDYNAKWLSHMLSTRAMRARIANRASGTSGSMKNIAQDAFLTLRILVPPLPEQREIAEILSTWDRAIGTVEQLITALQARKRGLMRQLLIPREGTGQPAARFPQFQDKWKIERLDCVFDRVTSTTTLGGQDESRRRRRMRLRWER